MPNVFLLVIDSLRADVVWGDDVPTPNIDAFAETGAAFRQCISTTTTTTPSMASLLTGCYPQKHGVRGLQGYRLSPAVRTMAETFGGAGYRTYAEVTGPLLPETGILRGFDEANHRPGYKVDFFFWRDEIINKIRSYQEPWFMLLHVWEVHRPFRSPPTFEKRWDKEGYQRAVAATDEYLRPIFDAVGDDALVVITGDHGEKYPESDLERLQLRLARKLRRALRPQKWSPGLDARLASLSVGHGFGLFEYLIRVPLIVAGPGMPAATVDDQVRHIDVFPTLADLVGLEPPPDADGRTLRPMMEGRELPEEPAYMEAVGVKLEGRRVTGVRVPDWKLIRHPKGKPVLYRLSADGSSDERRNVYNRHPEVAHRLESVIAEIEASGRPSGSGMTADEEAVVEQHLRDLGYL